MSVDTVLNDRMRPQFVDEPHVVLRRLKAGHSESWTKVLVGATGLVVTVPEYLHGEKLETVEKALRDVLRASQLPMYKRTPAALDKHLRRTAERIIEVVEGKKT